MKWINRVRDYLPSLNESHRTWKDSASNIKITVFISKGKFSAKEMHNAYSEHGVRYIIDKQKKIMYLWKAESGTHARICSRFGIQYKMTESWNGIFGLGHIKNGKIKPTGIDITHAFFEKRPEFKEQFGMNFEL